MSSECRAGWGWPLGTCSSGAATKVSQSSANEVVVSAQRNLVYCGLERNSALRLPMRVLGSTRGNAYPALGATRSQIVLILHCSGRAWVPVVNQDVIAKDLLFGNL